MLILLLYVLVYGLLQVFRRRKTLPLEPEIRLPEVFVDILLKADPVCMARMLHRDAKQWSAEDILVVMSKSKELLKQHSWNPSSNLHSLWYVGILCPADQRALVRTDLDDAEESPVDLPVDLPSDLPVDLPPELPPETPEADSHVLLPSSLEDAPPLPASPKKKKAKKAKQQSISVS